MKRLFRTVLLNGSLVGFSGLLAFCFGEVAVRVAMPQQLIIRRADIYQAVDTLGWLHQPNVVTTINSGERNVTLATDLNALRIAPGTTRAPNAHRVLILGDSFMEAVQVEHDSSTAGLLQTALRTSLADSTLETWNAGVGGWSPEQYRLRAEGLLRKTRFSAALVAVYLGNDIMQRRTLVYRPYAPTDLHTVRLPHQLSAREFVDALLYPANDFLEQRSHLFLLVKSRLETLRMRLGLTAAYFPPDFNRSVAGDGRWDTTAAILEEIARSARTKGIEPLFVLLPAPYQIEPAVMMQYARGFGLDTASIDAGQPNRLLGAAMTARGLRNIDVLPAFRDAQRAGMQLYGKVDQHFTAAGHAVLTAQVLPLIAGEIRRASISTPASKR